MKDEERAEAAYRDWCKGTPSREHDRAHDGFIAGYLAATKRDDKHLEQREGEAFTNMITGAH